MRVTLIFLAMVMALSSFADSDSKLEKVAARIHEAAFTVDSHTDTPLLLTRPGFSFTVRHDPRTARSKVDLPRMKEGGLDGIYFAVFVGQGERSSTIENPRLSTWHWKHFLIAFLAWRMNLTDVRAQRSM